MIFTDEQLQQYAQPLSATEEEKCKHAISMVVDALQELGYSGYPEKIYADSTSYVARMKKDFSSDEITVLLQGSYANNTNVRQESDVDIAVICESTFRGEYRPGAAGKDYGFGASSVTGQGFKGVVEQALIEKFGTRQVRRGDKSIKVESNTYRVKADCVPALRYRDYTNDYRRDADNYVGGIAIFPDSGGVVINYPEQHIQRGREKNVATNHAYKKCVRVAKKLTNMMGECGYSHSGKTSSFAVESLVFNVPDDVMTGHVFPVCTFDSVVEYLYENKDRLGEFTEANGIKPLCSDGRRESDLRSYGYSHEKGSGHKQSSVVVKQSLTSIWLSFKTDEVFTYSSSAELVEDGGMYYLQYIYKTGPKAAIAEANPSQFGACRLRVECSEGLLPKATKLLGTYWTNRKTMGDIVFSVVSALPKNGRHVSNH